MGRTPEFRDWLDRQEYPIGVTVTKERFREYGERVLGLRGKSLDVMEEVWEARYENLLRFGIRFIEYEIEYRGIRYDVTRAVITGMPGLWGRIRAYEVAAERAAEVMDWEAYGWFSRIVREMKLEPEYRKWRYRRL